MLVALIVGAYLMGESLSNDLAVGASSGDAADSLVLRISGTPGVPFSGNYTTTSGSQNINGTLGASPTDFEIADGGVAGMKVVTVNVRRQGSTGTLKAETLENGQVVQSQQTDATTAAVSLTYSP